jgi:hypothetical protein
MNYRPFSIAQIWLRDPEITILLAALMKVLAAITPEAA